jgi:hypothetical protein
MNDRQLNAFLLVLVAFAASLVIAFSQATNYVVIPNNGQISTDIAAKSGSAKDIQTAVNQAAASSNGRGNVRIPAGTFNFINAGDPWMTVDIPAGVNVFGAPTQRYANGSVISWNTILILPVDIGGDIDTSWQYTWFSFSGSGNPTKPSRISDVKLVGYRSAHPLSITMTVGISISNVMDFRIDHCCLEDICGDGITIDGLNCRGVIDHCSLYNLYGWDDLGGYSDSNVGYGIYPSRYLTAPFDATMNVLGKYTNYTIFIENCYFSWWRHCVSSGHGAHYVFRYNIIDQDLGHFSLDVHGLRDTQTNRAGGRAAEFYENTFTNVNQYIPQQVLNGNLTGVSYKSTPSSSPDYRAVLQDGGGCGVFFNNYIDRSYDSDGIALYTEDDVASATWHLQDFYSWSTKGPWPTNGVNGVWPDFSADRHVEAYWTRQAGISTDANYPNVDPSWSIAGYKPYSYPHPLTLGT